MSEIPWGLVAALATTGILMGLLSALVGMRPRLENPLWWALYAVWVTVVLVADVATPFRTLLIASTLAGVLQGSTVSLLLDHYIRNNPWHADKMQGPRLQTTAMFVMMGLVIGAVFGAIVGGIASGLSRMTTGLEP